MTVIKFHSFMKTKSAIVQFLVKAIKDVKNKPILEKR